MAISQEHESLVFKTTAVHSLYVSTGAILISAFRILRQRDSRLPRINAGDVHLISRLHIEVQAFIHLAARPHCGRENVCFSCHGKAVRSRDGKKRGPSKWREDSGRNFPSPNSRPLRSSGGKVDQYKGHVLM